MAQCKCVSTPLWTQFKLSKAHEPKTEIEEKKMSEIPYANIVGSIMYVMVCTRPDMAYVLSIVSRYMSNPGITHWQQSMGY